MGRKRDRPFQRLETPEKPFSQGLDTQPGGRIPRKHLPNADAAGKHGWRFVAGLAHDVALADSVHRRLGDASGAQAMAAQWLRLQTGAAGSPLQDPADAVLVEAAAGELTMTVDPAKDGAGGDARFGEPPAQHADRAGFLLLPKGNADLAAGGLLVGLRAAEINDEAVLGEGEVGKVDRGKLRAAEGAGEADKNQRPVTEAQQRLRAAGNDPADCRWSEAGPCLPGPCRSSGGCP